MYFPLPEDDTPDEDRSDSEISRSGGARRDRGRTDHHWDEDWSRVDDQSGEIQFGKTELTPDEEREWLNYLDLFDHQLEHAGRVRLRDYINNPTVHNLSELNGHALATELERILELMAVRGVYLEIQGQVEDAELYRFITEELFDEEVDDIQIDGFSLHFVYEEFHPNDELDVRSWSIEFLTALFDQDLSALQVVCSEDELYNQQGDRVDITIFEALIQAFWQRNPKILDYALEVRSVAVDGDRATVKLLTSWQGLKCQPVDIVTSYGLATVYLKRSACYGWDVIRARVPGWLELP